jgi:hypothetical protein
MRQLLFTALFIVPSLVMGQTRSIFGKVLIEDDLTPIPGVTIQDCDTVLLGTTNSKGNFKIELPLGATRIYYSVSSVWKRLQ